MSFLCKSIVLFILAQNPLCIQLCGLMGLWHELIQVVMPLVGPVLDSNFAQSNFWAAFHIVSQTERQYITNLWSLSIIGQSLQSWSRQVIRLNEFLKPVIGWEAEKSRNLEAILEPLCGAVAVHSLWSYEAFPTEIFILGTMGKGCHNRSYASYTRCSIYYATKPILTSWNIFSNITMIPTKYIIFPFYRQM